MNVFMCKNRPQDLIKGADVVLNQTPKDKERLNEIRTSNDSEYIHNNPPSEIIIGNKILVSVEKVQQG